MSSKIGEVAVEAGKNQSSQNIIDFDDSNLTQNQKMRNSYDHTQTAELVHEHGSDIKGQQYNLAHDSSDSFIRQVPKITKISGMDSIQYRGIDFKVKQLIDMRSVIHQKIEQLFSTSQLWNNMMPVKIFGDLINFISEHNND